MAPSSFRSMRQEYTIYHNLYKLFMRTPLGMTRVESVCGAVKAKPFQNAAVARMRKPRAEFLGCFFRGKAATATESVRRFEAFATLLTVAGKRVFDDGIGVLCRRNFVDFHSLALELFVVEKET